MKKELIWAALGVWCSASVACSSSDGTATATGGVAGSAAGAAGTNSGAGGSSSAGTGGGGSSNAGSSNAGASNAGASNGGAGGSSGSARPAGSETTCCGMGCPMGECDNNLVHGTTTCTKTYTMPLTADSKLCVPDGGYCLILGRDFSSQYWAIQCASGTPTAKQCNNGCTANNNVAACP